MKFMSSDTLRRLRAVLFGISLFDFCFILAFCGRKLYYHGDLHLWWGVLATFVSVIVIGISYLYSLQGPPFLHKYLRAFFMLFLSLFTLGIKLRIIDVYLEFEGPGFLNCSTEDAFCYLEFTDLITAIILGFLMLPEIALTVVKGPLPLPRRRGWSTKLGDKSLIQTQVV